MLEGADSRTFSASGALLLAVVEFLPIKAFRALELAAAMHGLATSSGELRGVRTIDWPDACAYVFAQAIFARFGRQNRLSEQNATERQKTGDWLAVDAV